MFNVMKRRSDNLVADKEASGKPKGIGITMAVMAPKGGGVADSEPTGGGPGIGPGTETDELAGDESAFDPGAAAAHHQKMADFHREAAGAEGSPEEEAGELPDFEALEDSGDTETPAEDAGEAPGAEEAEARGGPPEGSPEEEAGESPAFEETEDEGAPKKKPPFPPKKKTGPSRLNTLRKGAY